MFTKLENGTICKITVMQYAHSIEFYYNGFQQNINVFYIGIIAYFVLGIKGKRNDVHICNSNIKLSIF